MRRPWAADFGDDAMIKIEAVVRPERVNVVLEAMVEAGCQGYSYHNVTGRGQQQGVEVFTGRGGQVMSRASVPKTIISAVVKDDQKDAVIEAIVSTARSGEDGAIGDGKIFVSPVSEVVRVRTGERDALAL